MNYTSWLKNNRFFSRNITRMLNLVLLLAVLKLWGWFKGRSFEHRGAHQSVERHLGIEENFYWRCAGRLKVLIDRSITISPQSNNMLLTTGASLSRSFPLHRPQTTSRLIVTSTSQCTYILCSHPPLMKYLHWVPCLSFNPNSRSSKTSKKHLMWLTVCVCVF